jgi:hypothetical protein|tara:strand:+ start:236 stop:430 length:195 start_codon:yes stop_codon:yes gene_type:complete
VQWIKKLLGLTTPLDKKKKELSNIRVKAIMSQRDGDLRRYATLSKKAEELEDEIIELLKKSTEI